MHSVNVSNSCSLSLSSRPPCVCARQRQLMMPVRGCCTGTNSQRSGMWSGSLGAMLRRAKARNYACLPRVVSTLGRSVCWKTVAQRRLHDYLIGSALVPDENFLRAVDVIVERLPDLPAPSAPQEGSRSPPGDP